MSADIVIIEFHLNQSYQCVGNKDEATTLRDQHDGVVVRASARPRVHSSCQVISKDFKKWYL